jgi:nitrogen fixation NifU-like protein
MSSVSELYQSVILDHNRTPRNYGRLEGDARRARGYNPLCGDECTVWLKVEGDTVADVKFEGQGCAISKASASLMTMAVKGKPVAEAAALAERFHALVTGKLDEAASQALPVRLQVFGNVAQFPVRVKCASMPWHTLKAALAGGDAPELVELK